MSICIYNLLLFLGAKYYSNAYFGAGSGGIFLCHSQCKGYESTLLQCLLSVNNYASHSHDVGISCSNTSD